MTKKCDCFFPFDWGYRQKSDLTVLVRTLHHSDHPSPPPAKVRWLRFGLRQMSKIEALLDDFFISVCDMDAEQDNDEDAVLVHRLLHGCEKLRAFSKCSCIQRAIDSGIVTGDVPVSYWPIFFPTTLPEVSAKGPRTVVSGTCN